VIVTPTAPPATPPGAPPEIAWPRIPGEGFNLGAAEAAATDVGVTGAAGVGEGTVVAGGTALGEGAVVTGSGVAAGGTVVAEGTIAVGGTTAVAEGTVIAGAVAGSEVAGTSTAVAGAALASNPVGWVILGAIVLVGVGVVVYLVVTADDQPRQAPGAPGGAPVADPGTTTPATAPGTAGGGPMVDPTVQTPAVAPGAGPATPLQASGPLDGKRDENVYDSSGNLITDIDSIEGDTLWEEKSAVSATDIPAWVAEHITEKFEAYLRARAQLPPFYVNAAIGFRFQYAVKIDLATAIWDEIERLRAAHPDVQIQLDLPPNP
jgi:hypothetical protein